MRRDLAYLRDMTLAADQIARDMAQCTPEEFCIPAGPRRGTLYSFILLAEAAGRLAPATRSLAPDIPWVEIRRIRNGVIHEYDRADDSEFYRFAAYELPRWRGTLESLIERLKDDGPAGTGSS